MSDIQNQRTKKEELSPPNQLEGEPSSDAEVLTRQGEAGSVEAVSISPESAEPEVESIIVGMDEKQVEPVEAPGEIQSYPAIGTTLEKLEGDIAELGEILSTVQTRLAKVETNLAMTAEQVSFLPPTVRTLGSKIDGIVTSISEPRYKAVLLSLLGVYDLVDQVLRTLPTTPDDNNLADHRRNYEVLRTQLRQILEMNGLSEIDASGTFDPKQHCSLQRVPCKDPEQDGRIIEIVRPGFRTEHAVLRFAEVIVGFDASKNDENSEIRNLDEDRDA